MVAPEKKTLVQDRLSEIIIVVLLLVGYFLLRSMVDLDVLGVVAAVVLVALFGYKWLQRKSK